MSNRTRTYQLVEERLGENLADYVRRARDNGASWSSIAFELHSITHTAVRAETLRLWFFTEERDRAAQKAKVTRSA